jgi:hypothetical protein
MIRSFSRHHRRAKIMLYEYLRHQLDPSDERFVQAHVQKCSACSADLRGLADVIEKAPAPPDSPAARLPEEYWNAFGARVVDRIRAEAPEHPRRSVIRAEQFLIFNRRWVLKAAWGAALVAAGALAAIILWPRLSGSGSAVGSRATGNSGQVSSTLEGTASKSLPLNTDTSSVQPAFDPERMHEYFRKSKVLLVGLANIHPGREDEVDLTAERRASRSLVQETRYLQDQPLDHRSAKLIGDLQRILIELANTKDRNGAPEVQILQGGIHRENLLFKIRMAETMFDSTQFMAVRESY